MLQLKAKAMLKQVSLVMLPTKEKSKLVLSFKEKSFNQLIEPKLTLIEEANYQLSNIQSKHLYFTSDDEIKEGNWVILKVSDRRPLYCVKIKTINNLDKTCTVEFPYDNSTIEVFISGCKKVIATTDSSLQYHDKTPIGENINGLWKCLPKPSDSFIIKYVEEYNKGNVITDVLVDYENPYEQLLGNKIGSNWGHFTLTEENKWKLKVNPKDNTITIKKVKDSWNRDEVKELCKKSFKYGNSLKFNIDIDKWIEENL